MSRMLKSQFQAHRKCIMQLATLAAGFVEELGRLSAKSDDYVPLIVTLLIDQARSTQKAAHDAKRKLQVGSGDRSEKVRTYNFPQDRLTDHRINLTLHNLDQLLAGSLDAVVEPLLREYRAEQLSDLAESTS